MRTNLKYNIGNGYGHFCVIDDFSVDISNYHTTLGSQKNTLTIKNPAKTIENNSDDEVDTSKSEKCGNQIQNGLVSWTCFVAITIMTYELCQMYFT